MEYQPLSPPRRQPGHPPLSLILQGVSLPEKQRTSNCRPAKRRADDADFTRYNDGMNPKQMGDFISQTNNAL